MLFCFKKHLQLKTCERIQFFPLWSAVESLSSFSEGEQAENTAFLSNSIFCVCWGLFEICEGWQWNAEWRATELISGLVEDFFVICRVCSQWHLGSPIYEACLLQWKPEELIQSSESLLVYWQYLSMVLRKFRRSSWFSRSRTLK